MGQEVVGLKRSAVASYSRVTWSYFSEVQQIAQGRRGISIVGGFKEKLDRCLADRERKIASRSKLLILIPLSAAKT